MIDDVVIPFQLEKSSYRGRIVRLGPTLDEILQPHDYPDRISRLTGEAAVIGVLLSFMLKYEGIFMFQVQSEGKIKMLLADVTSDGDIRACARFDESVDWTQDQPLSQLLDKGYAAFTVDQGAHMDRYQGIVELKGETLTEAVQHYFTQSEQIKTGVKLAIDYKDGHWRAGAVMLQHMPEEGGYENMAGNTEEDDWRRAMILLGSGTDEELLNPSLGPEDLLFRLFHEEGVRVYEPKALHKGCRCSDEKLVNILKTMSPEDRRDMAEDDRITMRCEFCSRDFVYNADELEQKMGQTE